jgi:hypothetical protein
MSKMWTWTYSQKKVNNVETHLPPASQKLLGSNLNVRMHNTAAIVIEFSSSHSFRGRSSKVCAISARTVLLLYRHRLVVVVGAAAVGPLFHALWTDLENNVPTTTELLRG